MNTHVRDDLAFIHDPPSCRVRNSADISIPNNTLTVLTFNAERFDTDGMHSTSVNTGRITFATAGKYIIGGDIEWVGNVTNVRLIGIRLNGATIIAYADQINSDTAVLRQSVVTLYQFAAGDYVELLAYQNSGGALTVSALGNYSPEFWAAWASG